MNKNILLILGILIGSFALAACGLSQAEPDVQATQVGANLAATHATTAPTPTQPPTEIPTAIPTPTPTVDLEATAAVEQAKLIEELLT